MERHALQMHVHACRARDSGFDCHSSYWLLLVTYFSKTNIFSFSLGMNFGVQRKAQRALEKWYVHHFLPREFSSHCTLEIMWSSLTVRKMATVLYPILGPVLILFPPCS